VLQRWAAKGAISAVLVRDLVPEGANQYANHCILTGAVIGALLPTTPCGAKRKFQFTVGDAVAPALEEQSVDAIICRHLLWTLRSPQVALMNWRRLLRPKGRVVVVDGFWFTQAKPEGNELFERYYTDRTWEALPAVYWDRVEPVADLLTAAGFSDVTMTYLADARRLAEKPASAQPWFAVTGQRNE